MTVLQTADPAAYSIKTFCLAHGISLAMFFKLQREGLAPRTMHVGARRMISREEAARWRAAMTVAPNSEEGEVA